MGDFDARYRPQLEAALESGEELRGICGANHRQSAFKGRLVAIGVTDRRLAGAAHRPPGRARGLTSADPSRADRLREGGGAGGGWLTVEAAIADHSAVKLDLRMKDGEKLKLIMMRGEGALGKLGGGQSQREGIGALAAWFGRLEARRGGPASPAARRGAAPHPTWPRVRSARPQRAPRRAGRPRGRP